MKKKEEASIVFIFVILSKSKNKFIIYWVYIRIKSKKLYTTAFPYYIK